MLNIFLKDLRQNYYLILASIMIPIILPALAQVSLKFWNEDINFSLHLVFLFFYLPIYLSILSSSLITEENISLLKICPLSSAHIIFEKILFFFLNLIILGAFYFLILILKFPILSNDHIKNLLPFLYFTLLLSFLSFSFSTFLNKKIYAFIISFFLACINIIIFFSKFQFPFLNFIIDLKYYLILIILLLLAFLSIFFFFKKMIINKKIKLIEKLFFVLCFFSPYLYLLINLESAKIKNSIYNSSVFQVKKNEFILIDRYEKKLKYLDLKSKKLRELKNLEVFYFEDFKDRRIFFINNSKIQKDIFCNKEIELFPYYSFDIDSKRFEYINEKPKYILNIDEMEIIYKLIETDKYLILLKNNSENKCLEIECYRFLIFKDGIFYAVKNDFEYEIRFLNFKDFSNKEIIKGKYYFPLYLLFEFEKKLSEGNYFFLEDEKNLYRIKIPEGNIEILKDKNFISDFLNGYYIISENKDNKTIFYLYLDDKLLDAKSIDMGPYYPYLYDIKSDICILSFYEKHKMLLLKNENNKLKLYEIPRSVRFIISTLENDELLIYKETFFGINKKISLYNLKTGKERNL